MSARPVFRRVLLKLSGESLGGAAGVGFDAATFESLGAQLVAARARGAQLAVVVGGGNFFRGLASGLPGCDRVGADHIGMLATVMNALAMGHAVRARGAPATVLSAFGVEGVAERFSIARARSALDLGHVVIFGGGTGNPLFTTDSAAVLRAVECQAELLVKATRVDGVYDADPEANPGAARFTALSFDEAIDRRLKVMDATAFTLCREVGLPVRVIGLNRAGALENAILGLDEGTLIS